MISKYLRLDRGTETGHMATIHAFLRQDQDNEPDTVFYGPSTNNKVKEHLYTIDPTPFIITIINRWAFLNIVIIDV